MKFTLLYTGGCFGGDNYPLFYSAPSIWIGVGLFFTALFLISILIKIKKRPLYITKNNSQLPINNNDFISKVNPEKVTPAIRIIAIILLIAVLLTPAIYFFGG